MAEVIPSVAGPSRADMRRVERLVSVVVPLTAVFTLLIGATHNIQDIRKIEQADTDSIFEPLSQWATDTIAAST